MENIQKIKDYIERTEIKKSFIGGYNKVDVHKLLDTVLEMFETTLKEQKEKEEKRVADLLAEIDMIKEDAEAKAEVADALIVDLNKTIVSLTDDIEKVEEKMGNVQKGLSNLLEMINE